MVEGDVRGRFVIVCSVGALTTTAGSSSYSGSLFALRGLADTLRYVGVFDLLLWLASCVKES